jgi:PKD repeat protein
MQSKSALLRACVALLVVIVAGLVPHRLVQPEANATQVSFRWDYVASGAAGFVLYCGPSSKNYPTRIDVGNTDTYVIGTLKEGATSFCAVTAYDPAKVESSFSNEVSVLVPLSPPVVNFSANPVSGTAPVTVAFTNATTGSVTTWAWNFGDGTTSNVQSPTHVYSTPGSYTVVLTATGGGGSASKTAATAISVGAPTPPVVNFSASATTGAAPLSVTFTNTTTGQVTTWAWNFGDGTTSNLQSPTHVYSTPGSYTVALTATGAGGSASKTAATAISVTTAASPPANGLVAAYAFNEGSGTSVADASGNGNTGTINGAKWIANGRFGAALRFNGTDRVQIPSSASLNLSAGMTLEAWVSPAEVSSALRDVIYKGNAYYLEATSTHGGAPAAGGSFGEADATAPLTATKFAHLAVTYDRLTLRLYVNGVQVSSVARAASIAASTTPLQIGGDTTYGQYFKGRIDEVRVYNRALSQAEIQADMITPIAP